MAVSMDSVHQDLRPTAASPDADWRAVLAGAVRDPIELCRLLGLPASLVAEEAAREFPLFVPRTYLGRIRPGDPHDPLLAQILPQKEELTEVAQFVPDPVGEAAATCAAGLLRKYDRRLLIVASADCGVHCRFCFRRHFPYRETLAQLDWQQTIRRIADDVSVEEVILSGGDPLIHQDSHLSRIAEQLAEIPHLRRLRIHSRMPIVIPQRVTKQLTAWFRGTRLTTILVVHVNHPAEIDPSVAAALGRLVDAGVPLLSQTVLLRGVNDDPAVMADLCSRLVDLRVMPYYLHQLDRVAGAAHFEVPQSEGIALIGQLRARLPGYAVPRYVRDTPGAASKQALA